jgi:hypothetical protein
MISLLNANSLHMWYNSSCLDEQNTRALAFQEPPFSANWICGQSALHVRTPVLAVRLGNGGTHGGRFAMRNSKGQFTDGDAGEDTRFKKGEHWRPHKPYWDREWLYNEYIIKGHSSSEIAADFSITNNAICFWLNKHKIPTRSMSEVRAIKYWGQNGNSNPMFGRHGMDSPNWRGGSSQERQVFYSSLEWKKVVKVIRKRDKQICRRCGRGERPWIKEFHHIHHLVSFAVEKLRADPDNLILLCKDCHYWVHSIENAGKEFLREEVTE